MPSANLSKPNTALPGARIVVIGASGSGKTTFSNQLAGKLAYNHIELDAIHWLPDWQEMP